MTIILALFVTDLLIHAKINPKTSTFFDPLILLNLHKGNAGSIIMK